MATKLRLAVVHPCNMVRRGFMDMMRGWPHGEVVLEAADFGEYERACANLPRIHIAVVGLEMTVQNGYRLIRYIRRNQPRTVP